MSSKPDSAGIHIPPPFIYVAAFLIGLLLERVFPPRPLPAAPSRVAALICLVLWAILGLPSLLLFVRARTGIIPDRPATTLVLGGPYRFTRNPMYLSLIFLYIALALWFDLVWPIGVLPVVVLVIQSVVITREEHYLERRFGEEYGAYR